VTEDPHLAETPAIPFVEVMAHVRARRPRAIGIFSGIFVASLLVAAIFPSRFYATATLAVLPAPEFTVRQDAGSRSFSTSAFAMDQVMKAETEILQSTDLHEAALQTVGLPQVYPDLDPRADSVVWRLLRTSERAVLSPWVAYPADTAAIRLDAALHRFDNDLSVLPTKDANVIAVTFRHHDGAMAAQIVNALLSGYARRREKLYDDPQAATVRHETEHLGDAVGAADAALAGFKARHAISDYASERDLIVRRQSAAAQELADTDAAAAEQQARLVTLSRQIALIPANVVLYRENDPDTRLQTIDSSLVELRSQIAAARVHYRDASHKVTDLTTQLTARDAERARLARDKAPSVERAGRSLASDSLLLDRARAATEEAAAVAKGVSLRRELQDVAARLAALTGEEAALADLERRKSAADAAFASASQVLAERQMTEAEDALRLANVRVIQRARTPLHAAPIPLLVIIAGTLLGALAACVWCISGVLIRPTLLTVEGLGHATGLPVLATFPDRSDLDNGYAVG
jgi:uncharacterized protein involved in exopolysaccharide biosynthesis